MIDKQNKVEVFDGRKRRWILAEEVAEFRARGFEPVGEAEPVRVELKPRKLTSVVSEAAEDKPTSEE
jgi:hypothetical protein